MGKVYDRSATYGNKPCPTVELQGEQLGKAVAVLTALSTVEVQFDDKQPTGFLADENLILYPSGATPIPAPEGYTMPPDYMAQAGTVSLAYVAELTCPEITEDLYDELQELEESLL